MSSLSVGGGGKAVAGVDVSAVWFGFMHCKAGACLLYESRSLLDALDHGGLA